MKCEECLPLLEEYADGELNAGAAARVEAHLGDCAACAREHRKLEEERAVFLAYECDAAPAERFWDEVLSKIDAEADAHKASVFAPTASAPARAGASRGGARRVRRAAPQPRAHRRAPAVRRRLDRRADEVRRAARGAAGARGRRSDGAAERGRRGSVFFV